MTDTFFIFTSTIGTKINAANTGAGVKNPDGSFNVTGTVIGGAQTVHSIVDFASIGATSGKLIPGVGMGLAGAGAIDSAFKIKDALNAGNPVAKSDLASVVGNAASFAGGAVLVLAGTAASPALVVGLTVVAVGAGVYQLAASAKGWTVGGQQVALTAAQQLQAEISARGMLDSKAGRAALTDAGVPVGAKVQVGGTIFVDPTTSATLMPPVGLNTTRISANYVTDNGVNSNSITVGSGGTLSDVLLLQNRAGNSITAADIQAANPSITDVNVVAAGQIIYIPQKHADGSITYPFAKGASITSNVQTGAYSMTPPTRWAGLIPTAKKSLVRVLFLRATTQRPTSKPSSPKIFSATSNSPPI